ncbi:fimbrillin family protein [Parabacteroides sp.]
MKQTTNIFILGFALLLTACSSGELPDTDNATVAFRPDFHTGETQTRSIVNSTGTTTAGGAINEVNVYVTKKDGSAIYPGTETTNGVVTFTKQADYTWEGKVNLHSETARIYAYYPTSITTPTLGGSNVNGSGDIDTHYIEITPLADQTFDGTKDWDCSTVDYLYGTNTNNPSEATPIEASNKTGESSLNPSIYLQHALAQVAFTMKTAPDRPLTNFDYIKKITIKATGDNNTPFVTAAHMLLKDGTLNSTTNVAQLTFTPTGESGNGTGSTAVKCGEEKAPALVGYGLVAPLSSQPATGTIKISVLLGAKGSNNTENERELTATLENPAQWLKGKRYVYPITLTNLAITVGKTTITPWDQIDSGSDMKPDGI